MKYAVILLALIMIGATCWAQEARIVLAKNGKNLSLKDLAKDLAKYDLIFFGEFHDNAVIHALQKDLLPLMDAKRELVLSFEMFERDVQSELDAYIEGWSSEEQFLQNSRPWQNYDTDYRPLVEYAKQHKLSAIAANVPRRYAGQLARAGIGFINELEESERNWLAKKLNYPDDEYKKAFMQTMGEMGNHGISSNSMEQIYMAQCLKDDTMAESIVRVFEAKPKARVIHYNGDFHSREFLGTVSRVHAALPKLKIAVISPVYKADWQTAKLSPEDKKAGTYLVFIPAPDKGGEE